MEEVIQPVASYLLNTSINNTVKESMSSYTDIEIFFDSDVDILILFLALVSIILGYAIVSVFFGIILGRAVMINLYIIVVYAQIGCLVFGLVAFVSSEQNMFELSNRVFFYQFLAFFKIVAYYLSNLDYSNLTKLSPLHLIITGYLLVYWAICVLSKSFFMNFLVIVPLLLQTLG